MIHLMQLINNANVVVINLLTTSKIINYLSISRFNLISLTHISMQFMKLKNIEICGYVKSSPTHIYVDFKWDHEITHSCSNDFPNKVSLKFNSCKQLQNEIRINI